MFSVRRAVTDQSDYLVFDIELMGVGTTYTPTSILSIDPGLGWGEDGFDV
jgi:hypothetical protein